MALTNAQAAEKAHNMAIPDGDETIVTVPDVELMIPEALEIMCDKIAASEKYYRLQTVNSSITVTSGVGNLPALIIAESILPSRGADVTFTRTDVVDPQFRGSLSPLPSLNELKRPRPGGNEKGYYTVRGGQSGGLARLFVYSGLGEAATGTAEVLACVYYTSLASLPTRLEDDFLMALAEMVKTKIGEMKTPSMQGA